jgi:DNA-binding transcriptional ArsR family regulator
VHAAVEVAQVLAQRHPLAVAPFAEDGDILHQRAPFGIGAAEELEDVLARLREERYGYTLRQALAGDGIEMEESTLYPLLRRLETQGLLTSEWREEEKRRKRFYRLSPMGTAMLAALATEWRGINASLDKII